MGRSGKRGLSKTDPRQSSLEPPVGRRLSIPRRGPRSTSLIAGLEEEVRITSGCKVQAEEAEKKLQSYSCPAAVAPGEFPGRSSPRGDFPGRTEALRRPSASSNWARTGRPNWVDSPKRSDTTDSNGSPRAPSRACRRDRQSPGTGQGTTGPAGSQNCRTRPAAGQKKQKSLTPPRSQHGLGRVYRTLARNAGNDNLQRAIEKVATHRKTLGRAISHRSRKLTPRSAPNCRTRSPRSKRRSPS